MDKTPGLPVSGTICSAPALVDLEVPKISHDPKGSLNGRVQWAGFNQIRKPWRILVVFSQKFCDRKTWSGLSIVHVLPYYGIPLSSVVKPSYEISDFPRKSDLTGFKHKIASLKNYFVRLTINWVDAVMNQENLLLLQRSLHYQKGYSG